MILIIFCLQSEKKVVDKSLYSSSSTAVTMGKMPKISSFSSLNNSWRLASWVTSTFLIVSSSFSWVEACSWAIIHSANSQNDSPFLKSRWEL